MQEEDGDSDAARLHPKNMMAVKRESSEASGKCFPMINSSVFLFVNGSTLSE